MHHLRAALLVAALSAAAAASALPALPCTAAAQEPADSTDARRDTVPPGVVSDTIPLVAPDTVGPPAEGAAADSAKQDTLRQKILDRTPLFPADVDPYTPLGSGAPDLVIDRDELLGWPEVTLAEVLPRLLPLAVDDQGGPGFFQDVRFPSAGPAATRITIDGRPLESPLGPAADLRAVPVLAIERIEVRSGGAAAVGAEAGWINVVTRTHLTPQANSGLTFELGSFDREGFGAFLGRWLGRRVSVFGALQFDDGETFSGVANADRSRFWLKGRFYLSRTHFVEGSYGTSGVTTDTNLRDQPGPGPPFIGREDRRERRLQLLYRGRLGPVLASAALFSDRFDERDGFTLEGAQLLLGSFDRRGARVAARLDVGGGLAELGASLSEEDPESEVPPFAELEGAEEPDTSGAGAAIRTLAPFAAAELALDSLSVHARAELRSFEAGAASASEPAATIGARWAAPAGFSLFARLARTARAPSLIERAVLVRSGVEDPLPIASAREVRAGAGWRRGTLEVEAAGFLRNGSDAELWLPPTAWRGADGSEDVRLGPPVEDQTPFGDLNVIDVRAQGAEGKVRIPLPLGVVGEGAVRVQSAEDETGATVPYVPGVTAVGRLAWERRFFPSRNLGVRAAVDGRVTSARETLSGEDLPAYGVVDALLRVQLIGFTFGLDVQNALDLIYRTEEGFTPPGRIVGFEVLWEFWN